MVAAVVADARSIDHRMEADPTAVLNAFTVDVEDYFQVSALETCVDRRDWDRWESRVVANTQRVLGLLARHNVKATFFVLGWVAERYPELVREIHGGGHEIASHGYWHRLIYQQTPEEFRADLRQSLSALADITGEAVLSYRAPSFSITKRSLWALDVLVEEGIRFDSSIFPIRHDRYGIPGARRGPHVLTTRSGSLWEFPPSVARFAGISVPIGGGGYFRLYPAACTISGLRRINRRDHQSAMFYVHPWELDASQPRVPVRSRLSRFRHYVNISRSEDKLAKILREFRFGSVQEAIAVVEANESTIDLRQL